jgi:hypothetical protein
MSDALGGVWRSSIMELTLESAWLVVLLEELLLVVLAVVPDWPAWALIRLAISEAVVSLELSF